MAYPLLSDARRLEMLVPPTAGPVRAVLDTDAYNEIDDQFALVYALLAAERIALEAVYAAPFHNARSSGPGEGMEKSHAEIGRLLALMGVSADGFAFRGSRRFLPGARRPVESEAAADLVARAGPGGGGPLYVIAVGAPTNVASAILAAPEISGRVVVVWLGGHAPHWPQTAEFNLRQDLAATRVLLDSGVPLVRVPCAGVSDIMHTTVPEMAAYAKGRGAAGDYLFDIFSRFSADYPGRAKVLWDVAAVAWLVNPDWVPTVLVPSPLVSDALTWSADGRRHLSRVAWTVKRAAVFHDFFARLERKAKTA